MKETRSLLFFIIITFILSIVLSILAWKSDPGILQYFRFSAMLIPAIGVLIMGLIFNDPVNNVGWKKLPIKWILPAILLLPLAIHIISLPVVGFLNGSTPWQTWLIPNENGLYDTPESRGWGILTFNGLVFRIIMNAFVGLLIVSILAFFEEIGWRSWMLPRLIKKFNLKIGLLVSALVWSFWHIPFVLGGMNRIDGISLFSMLLLYSVGLFGAGIVIGWFWTKTKSIWIVCLSHGALNNWGQYAFKYMQDGSTDPANWPWLYTAVNGAMLILGIIIFITLSNNPIPSVNTSTNNV